MSFGTLLRYPGSKRRLIPFLPMFLEENRLAGASLTETHAGSAVAGLSCVARGLVSNLILVENDPLIYAIWHCCVHHADEFIRRVTDIAVTVEAWKKAREFMSVPFSDAAALDFACAGLVLNRCSFSGILSAGPIGGRGQNSRYRIDCRFSKATVFEAIWSIAALAPRLRPVFGDAVELIPAIKRKNNLLYVDPPYFRNGRKFYRKFYVERDHLVLRDVLSKAHVPWLLSYDDSDFIRQAYAGFEQVRISWFQSAKKPRVETELLISNVSLRSIREHGAKGAKQLEFPLSHLDEVGPSI